MNNREVVENFCRALQGGDNETARSLLHPEFRIHEAESLPYGGIHYGFDGIFDVWRGINASWANVGNNCLAFHGQPEDEFIFLEADLSGTSHKTGKSFKISVLERYWVKDGKLFEILPHYFDTKAVWDVDQD